MGVTQMGEQPLVLAYYHKLCPFLFMKLKVILHRIEMPQTINGHHR
jgi:hypothetical protein